MSALKKNFALRPSVSLSTPAEKTPFCDTADEGRSFAQHVKTVRPLEITCLKKETNGMKSFNNQDVLNDVLPSHQCCQSTVNLAQFCD